MNISEYFFSLTLKKNMGQTFSFGLCCQVSNADFKVQIYVIKSCCCLSFQCLVQCRQKVAEVLGVGELELELSMGMSHDFEHAVSPVFFTKVETFTIH